MWSDGEVMDVGKLNPTESHSNVSLLNRVVRTILEQSGNKQNDIHAQKSNEDVFSSYYERKN